MTGERGARSSPSSGLKGAVTAPGDKSMSHRALLFGAMAEGETRVHGLLEGEDVLRTGAAMRAFGAGVERRRLPEGGAEWRVAGAPWTTPECALYFGNSGTGCRLVLGAAAGRGLGATFEGDASLRKRPMERVLGPLRAMGAAAEARDGKLPVILRGGARLKAIDYTMPTASAQVKSAILLAGLGAEGTTVVRERERSRDHTERMLGAFGVKLDITEENGVRAIALAGGQRLVATEVDVPGDPSSAAFLAAAAAVTPGSDVLVRGVLVNPLRAGFFETLREMGADIAFENARTQSGEPVADIRVRASNLRGVAVPASRAASMIDEYPILAVVAAFAEGDTYMPGVSELRVKESDRLAAVEAGLVANGVNVETGPDWMRVFGKGRPAGGGRVVTHMDHRIAMSFLVLGLGAKAGVAIDDAAMIATSFPTFFASMQALGANLSA